MTWGTTDLTVRYPHTLALDAVTFAAPAGQVSAVVGGDGAGKSTLLRSLVGAVRPTSGRVDVPPPREVGFMPTRTGVWRELTVAENVDFVAAAYKVRDPARRAALLDAAGLADVTGRLAGDLSGGMRQKLAFTLAMLHAPRLLVLDEPSTGVDPVSRVELWRLITRAAVDGAAVVLSTTYLDEAERAGTVCVLDNGRVLRSGPPDEVMASTPGTITVTDDPPDRELAWRRGRRWHAWHPGPPAPGETPIPADMEDAVIAATLAGRTR
ncbi:ABC transporter ATP-binding protein [Longispora sp. K20-0274]|uniref:ABC transporter ATP-binding protein n=1 Tax=Longispora sp. K20-0274 TaxID=3088255 RepID=UPI003999AE17